MTLDVLRNTEELVAGEVNRIYPEVGAVSKIPGRQEGRHLCGRIIQGLLAGEGLAPPGHRTVIVGSQTGNSEDYEYLREICDNGTVIVDDTNPLELSRFMTEKNVDLLIGGVKERPIAYKMGVAFCDHNHERKVALAGFEGMLNFCREVYSSIMSPVWEFSPARIRRDSRAHEVPSGRRREEKEQSKIG
jgi:nitrogenase molybdenum-cofactor synthesis protein NifE